MFNVLTLYPGTALYADAVEKGFVTGDEWQRFANLRAYLTSMYAHPGKKLLFMGSELAPYDEWSHDRSLDWHLLDYALHRGVQSLVRDLNALCRGLCLRACPSMEPNDARNACRRRGPTPTMCSRRPS